MKRPDRIKLNVCKTPSGLQFFEDLFRRDSIYIQKLREALSVDGVVEVMDADKYALMQFKSAAKKCHLKLMYARSGDKCYIKPIAPSDQEKRLLLYLRELRTFNELLGQKFELDLQATLTKLRTDGAAHLVKDKWTLTERGKELV